MPARRVKSKTRSATPNEKMLGVFGLGPAAYIARGLPPNAWEEWNKSYGSTWRLQHRCANELDRARLDRGLVDLASIVPDPPGLRGEGALEKSPDGAEKPTPAALLRTGLGDSAKTRNQEGDSNA